MSLDTPHGPITKILKNVRKIKGKIIFPTICCLIQKLDHNLGLHAKLERISRSDIRGLLWPLGRRKCGIGGKWYKERGKCIIESRIEFPNAMLMTLDTPHGPNTKFLKKCLKNAGKIKEKIFPPLWFLIKKTRSQFSPACQKSERYLYKQSEKALCMEMWTFPFKQTLVLFLAMRLHHQQ